MRRAASILLALAAVATSAGAQVVDLASADRAPRFLYASSARAAPVAVEPRSIPALGRRVTLQLDDVSLREALDAISRESGVRLFYSKDLLPLEQVVRIRAEDLTVAAVLTEVLFDTDVDVLLGPNNQAALVRRGTLPQGGTITGRVTDARTESGVAGVRVFLERTRWSTTTDSAGRYRLADVVAGAYTLVARRIGYKPATQAVTVEDEREVTVNVVLQPAPSELEAVVVTATGEQQLLELGHVVGTINADSLVREAPVSNLTELLNGRVSGLQVFQSGGTVGGDVHLRVRSPNSLLLDLEPIVIVDGVRYTGGNGPTGPWAVEPTSRLNDINPNDIESIEVVKGPSAATLYGTDAANGVIVVTTKRGKPGPARWNAYARGTMTENPAPQYPGIYWGWSSVGGAASDFNCLLLFQPAGICTQDSVTVLRNPLNDPQLSLFASKPSWNYGLNVGGGQQDLRYYFSGDFERAIGLLQMPPALADFLRRQRGVELSEEQLDPNAFTKSNFRANVTMVLGDKADLRVNTGYTHNATRTVVTGSFFNPYSVGAFAGSPTSPYGTFSDRDPAEVYAQTSTERTERFFGTVSGLWRPAPWLLARATVGLDLLALNRYSLLRRGDAPNSSFPNGLVGDDRARQVATTAELATSATLRRGRFSSRTSIGAQYVRNLNDVLSSQGEDLPPGGTSVGQAANRNVVQTYRETITLGSYLEEALGLNERLFLTGALRVDGGSAFGRDYDATVYPKAGVSWLVSEEPLLPQLPWLEELRLRYAYGASGKQPLPAWPRPTFTGVSGVQNGAPTPVVLLTALGNPDLRPERVREHEFGFDATGFGNQVRLGVTWYSRRTVDQIVPIQLPPGLGVRFTNLGQTTGRGFEAEVTVQALDTRLLSWDLALRHSSHTTNLVALGEAVPRYSVSGGYVEGYPLGARFMARIVGYVDANGDGIIDINEIQVSDSAVYAGVSTPPRSQTLTTALGFFQRRLRISALIERRAGLTQINGLKAGQCFAGSCRALVDPTASLGEQAEAVAARFSLAPPTQFGAAFTFLESGTFTRLREVTAALDLPPDIARALRVQSATLSVAARNLALWTRFSGPDPESATVSGLQGFGADGVPQGRSWTLRLDLGL